MLHVSHRHPQLLSDLSLKGEIAPAIGSICQSLHGIDALLLQDR
jgi:hypothetical protein